MRRFFFFILIFATCNLCLIVQAQVLEDNPTASNKEIEDLKNEAAKLRKEPAVLEEEIKEKDAQIEGLNQQFIQIKSLDERLLADNRELFNLLEETEKNSALLSKKLDQAAQENVLVANELTQLKENYSRLQESIKDLNQQLTQIKDEKGLLAIDNQKLSVYLEEKEKDLSLLTKELEEATKERLLIANELTQLKENYSRLQESTDKEAVINELNQRIATFISEGEELKSTKNELEITLKDKEEELIKLNRNIAASNKEIEDLKNEAAKLRKEPAALEEKIKEKDNQVKDLNQQLTQIKDEKGLLAIDNQKLSVYLEEKEKDLSLLTKELEEATKERLLIGNELSQLKEDHSRLQEFLRRKLVQHKEEYSNLQELNQVKEETIDELNQKIATLTSQEKKGKIPKVELEEVLSKEAAKKEVVKEEVIKKEGAQISKIQEGYHLGPDDALKITVYREEELDRAVRLSSDGYISFPLLGRIKAEGLTVSELEDGLTEGLKRYLKNPQVTVFIDEYSTFTVTGEVKKPGSFELRGQVTVLEAIGLAGGFTKLAARNKVKILRLEDGKQKTIIVRVASIEKRGDKSKDIYLRRGDVVVVPESLF